MGTAEERSFHLLENVIFLKKSPIFSTMKTSELRAVAAIAEELSFESGQEIVREDDLGDSMYLIKEGTVTVSKKMGEGRTIDLAEMSQGDCFGEMAIFDAEVRSASVHAKGPCTIVCVKSDDLLDVLLDHPSIAVQLLKIFVKRLRKANGTIQDLSAGQGKPKG